MSIIIGVIEEGLIYAIMALGLYITYKILDFPDLSVDGTFPMGAAVTAMLILKGVHPALTLVLSFAAGLLAGCITGLIHVKLKVRDLLSGIIMMTALYSINLRIAGKANLPIFSKETIFENAFLESVVPEALDPYLVSIILFVIVLVCKILLDLFLKTRAGYLLRAVGDNEVLVTSLAKDKGMVKILGTKLLKRFHSVKATTAVIFGSIVYKACVSLAIALGMAASDLKLITAVLFLIILVASNRKERKVKAHA